MSDSLENVKQSLNESKESLKNAIRTDLAQLEDDITRLAKVVAIGAGVAVATYLIVSKVFFRKKKVKSDPIKEAARISSLPMPISKKDSLVLKLVKEQIALYIAALLKRKLAEYMESRKIS
jgi:hypothetical protein